MVDERRGLGSRACSAALLVELLLIMAGCGPAPAGTFDRSRVVRRDPAASSSSSSVVTYKGGPVLSAADVVAVFWGNAVSAGVVDQTPDIYRSLTR
jgi:hypothetical protein